MGKVSTSTDPNANALFITLDGNFSTDEIEAVITAGQTAVDALTQPFTVVCDISTFQPTSMGAANRIREAVIILHENGMNRFIGIVGSSSASRQEVERLAKRAPFDVAAVDGADDAHALL